MSDLPLNRDQKLSVVLLEAARTNSKIIKILSLLRSKVAPGDESLNAAMDELLDQQNAQLDKLEVFING